jgi:anti-anti-sigma factor
MRGQLTSSPLGGEARRTSAQGEEARRTSPHHPGSPGEASSRPRTPFALGSEVHRRNQRDMALTSLGVWRHTIVLTGALTHRTAHELEVEIEQRCADGVTAITLDLRELTYIDSIGVAVIAFRSRLCKRRGYEFAVVAGAPMMRRAFAQAGVGSLLDQVDEPDLGQVHSLALTEQARDSEA